MDRLTRPAGALVLTAMLLGPAGCGGRAPGTGGATEPAPAEPAGTRSPGRRTATATPTGSPSPAAVSGTVVAVRIADGRVTPNGERVRVGVGEPVTFRISSDAAGELHLHATPEDSLSFGAGTTRWVVTLRQPGVAEVELHEPPVVLVQLEAR